MTETHTDTRHTTQLPAVSQQAANRGRPTAVLARLWQAFRRFNADTIELQERLLLINQPWREEFLHYAHDGRAWQLHGHRIAPDGRTQAVTSNGWCPGQQQH